jgi:peptidoglycan/xylan/chitin deacetylase (PgdA/CDA1 family)
MTQQIEGSRLSVGAPPERRLAILAYHQTAPDPGEGTPYRHLTLPPWRFALQMKSLRALGWRGVSMREFMPYQRGEKTGKVFGLTFDDGYLSNFEHALPVLQEIGFTATLFMVSNQIGGSNTWDRELHIPESPLMGIEHLQAWLGAGMEIGAHTRNHVDLTACDEATAREEIAGSRRDLENALSTTVTSFCYPYGRHRAEHAEMVRQAGYRTATTIESARTHEGDDLMRLPRITVYFAGSLVRVIAQVTTGFEDWRMARARRRSMAA